jgi:hypothetical protein
MRARREEGISRHKTTLQCIHTKVLVALSLSPSERLKHIITAEKSTFYYCNHHNAHYGAAKKVFKHPNSP